MSRADISNFTGTGNLTQDPEIRQAGKTVVCTLNVAQNIGTGQYQSTSFAKFEVWGKLGEIMNQYAKKGDKLAFSGGQYMVQTFENKKGEKKKAHWFKFGMGAEIFFMSSGKRQSDNATSDEPPQADTQADSGADDTQDEW